MVPWYQAIERDWRFESDRSLSYMLNERMLITNWERSTPIAAQEALRFAREFIGRVEGKIRERENQG